MGGLRAISIGSYSKKPLSQPNRFKCKVHMDLENHLL